MQLKGVLRGAFSVLVMSQVQLTVAPSPQGLLNDVMSQLELTVLVPGDSAPGNCGDT